MSNHAAENGHPEQSFEQLDEIHERLRDPGRAAMGVTGDEAVPPLFKAMRQARVGWYTAVALGVLGIVDQFHFQAGAILGPEISSSIGISKELLAALASVKFVAIYIAALPMAAFVYRHPRRAVVAVVAAFVWSVTTLATGFVTEIWGFVAVMILAGAASGSITAVHYPLLVDAYPTSIRVRILSVYTGFTYIGLTLSPLLVFALTGPGGFTWRGAFVGLGLLSLLASVVSLRLRDPGFGRWDTDRIRDAVRSAATTNSSAEAPAIERGDVPLGVFEVVRRLFLIPTVRRFLLMLALYGMLYLPYQTFLSFFLDERWNMGPDARALFFAGMYSAAVLGLVFFGKKAESLFQSDPTKLVRLVTLLLASSVVVIIPGVALPFFPAVILAFGLSAALVAMIGPSLLILLFGIIPAQMRPHASALFGIFLAVGSFAGLLLLGGIDQRYGIGPAIVALTIPGGLAMFALSGCSKTINDDLNRTIDNVIEEEEIRVLRTSGAALPMLACRHIDFSYGQLQVLFDIDFTVDEGEIVALLGTNGAGKSTLLRVISGMGLPTRGTVRLQGADITYVDAERRLRMGITQIPGGRAVFGPLTVVENMKVFAAAHGRQKRVIDSGIDASFSAFPVLEQRRNQLASTLSGGEQQMLGLSKALILNPRLLLVDELSLGLAPKIVAELLDMLRRINAAGTAVVLVEQSVNVALSIVNHAYFMEKGEIKFDGRAEDLLDRPDLLRSVFLEGAAKGLARTRA